MMILVTILVMIGMVLSLDLQWQAVTVSEAHDATMSVAVSVKAMKRMFLPLSFFSVEGARVEA
jgi:hypothetical protein